MLENDRQDIINIGEELCQHLNTNLGYDLHNYVSRLLYIIDMDPADVQASYMALLKKYPSEFVTAELLKVDKAIKVGKKFRNFEKFSQTLISSIATTAQFIDHG